MQSTAAIGPPLTEVGDSRLVDECRCGLVQSFEERWLKRVAVPEDQREDGLKDGGDKPAL